MYHYFIYTLYFHKSIYDNQLATYLPNYNRRMQFQKKIIKLLFR